MKTKYLFITGGVISGLGKGIAAASIGRLLKARGFKTFVLKMDPYLNVDPGVLSPYEHGEVYVTNDGGETDLDLGHYERFLGITLSKDSSISSGKLLTRLINNERNGKYNGKTVQIVPHFTDEIKKAILSIGEKYNPDFAIVEIGGTVGDIESNAFFHTIAQLKYEMPDLVYLIHNSFVPFLNSSGDFKSKPTQQSIALLRQLGISPNMVVLRSHKPVTSDAIEKIAKYTFLPKSSVISIPDFKQVYEIPLYLEEKGICEVILNNFNIENKKAYLDDWKNFVSLLKNKDNQKITIAMVGKYTTFEDAYKSIIEALKIAAAYEKINLKLKWVESENIKNNEDVKLVLEETDGILILPGFGHRGIDGKIIISEYSRENNIPTLGICLGMQVMSINQARRKGIKKATSYEFKTNDKEEVYVLDYIRGKDESQSIGGSLRLGASDTEIKEGTKAFDIYKKTLISERHRHRFEINPMYRNQIEDDEFIFSGQEPKTKLAEICELKSHKFYVGVQYHPEFNSQPLDPHPLFLSFIKAMK
ncbi:CTP synthase [Mycoplasma phocimorsus]|uniref:CTP synthase n=1 Tax=Mycoplasma phocimorsus TaxID=3045839 RepID=UPI0024BF4FE1|nr:CTP synthase [Mycoplasma phocimorsus]MDJ1647113.1 CTP synthase [Mycoplasma phocimorsus]